MGSSTAATAVRFVGMLPSGPAETVARSCIRLLEPNFPHVSRWDVCVFPPLAAPPVGGYAVRVQARLDSGDVLSIRSQAGDLLPTVRDAFEGLADLLRQEFEGWSGPPAAWLPRTAPTAGQSALRA